jgi:hypothetical protein
MVPLDPFEEEGGAAGLRNAAGDCCQFQLGIDLDFNASQVAGLFERFDKVGQRV